MVPSIATICRKFSGLLLLPLWILSLQNATSLADSYGYWPGKEHNPTQSWLNHGGNIYNRRYADKETNISPKTVSKLKLKWEFYAGKDISATPAIFNGSLYFPCSNGYLYAVKASDGSLIWKKNLHKLTGLLALVLLLL
ncbi:uncharacterized protein LOC110601350 isoform X2 [Manihot esculenta]|uniref:uncharacterized protein LOC110601350 isoform X2 n=1 Tax=Manihot esculenta TaxID=3983 RepID=UPI001CC77F0D|nr:uncharacterized protein LOC110601350 isoform X2 [Manihot esculenta]